MLFELHLFYKIYMKVQLTIKHLKTTNQYLDRGALKIYIGNNVKIESAQEISRNNVFYFLQKNTTQLQQPSPTHISIDFMKDKKYVARKSLFMTEAIQSKEINLNPINKTDDNTYILYYQLKLTHLEENSAVFESMPNIKIKRKRVSIQQQQDPLLDEKGKVKFLSLGKLMNSFGKRLDPMTKLYYYAKAIFLWKMPELTFAIAILLTLFIMFPQVSIIFIALAVIFGQNTIINKTEQWTRNHEIHLRLLPPQDNIRFLEQTMQLYCKVFDDVYEFIQDDDRTKLLSFIQILCKGVILIAVLSILLPLQYLLIVLIWVTLFFTSSSGKRAIKLLWPKIINYNRLADKMIKNLVRSPVAKVFASNKEYAVQKQFYIYEHQRWWLGSQWNPEYYSDESKVEKLYARIDAPHGWAWLTEWHYEKTENTDPDGFQYANDLARNIFNSSKSLKTIRRRKWLRKCIKKSIQMMRSSKKIDPQGQIEEEQKIKQIYYSPQKSSRIKYN